LAAAKLTTINDPVSVVVIEQFNNWHYQRRSRALSDRDQLRQGHILAGRQASPSAPSSFAGSPT